MEFVISLGQIHPILEWIRDQLKNMYFDPAQLHRIELASEEALVNILNHAYQGRSEKVEIQVKTFSTQYAEIAFIDTGPSFNPLHVKAVDPNLPLEQRQIGGLGIHLMRNCIDEIQYARVGKKNILKFIILKKAIGSSFKAQSFE